MKQYEKSITSQWGEDGVLEEIFRRIGTTNKIAVDIGAWDGKHFSNTWNLAANHDWTRLLVEQDHDRLYSGEHFTKDFLLRHEAHNVDTMLDVVSDKEGLEVPVSFDLLCIDIDGDDYYLWKDMVKYKPRVVVIEYNQTVPQQIDIVQERGGTFGASFRSLYLLSEEKGYYLAHATTTNLIFVLKEYAPKFIDPLGFITPPFPPEWLCYIVTGYNGKRYMIGTPAHNDDQSGKHEKLITDVKLTEI